MWEGKPQEKKWIGQQQEGKGLLILALARGELFCPPAGGRRAAAACRRARCWDRDCDGLLGFVGGKKVPRGRIIIGQDPLGFLAFLAMPAAGAGTRGTAEG